MYGTVPRLINQQIVRHDTASLRSRAVVYCLLGYHTGTIRTHD